MRLQIAGSRVRLTVRPNILAQIERGCRGGVFRPRGWDTVSQSTREVTSTQEETPDPELEKTMAYLKAMDGSVYVDWSMGRTLEGGG